MPGFDAPRWIRVLISFLGAVLAPSFAAAAELEKLAHAVRAVASASRSSDQTDGLHALERIDPEERELLRTTFGARAAKAVGDLRVESIAVPGARAEDSDVLGDLLRSEPELADFGSISLGFALTQTRQYYAGRGNPLPDALKVLFSITFPREALDAIRVVDTGDEPTLPAIINEVQTRFGEAVGGRSAVTVDGIIAFSEIPENSAVAFWAHEIQHVMQYRKLGGIEAFAAEYTRNHRQLESEANAVARQAILDAQDILRVIRALNPSSLPAAP
jgi:hypothetical protein